MTELPVAIVGAGPIGLAAAAHLTLRGQRVRIYEAGAMVGASIHDWAHVRVFTPWRYNVDEAARTLLERHGWTMPPADHLPTGGELQERYLQPLAETPELAPHLATSTRVAVISRLGLDKVGDRGRAQRPFRLRLTDGGGTTRHELARAVIDASGTWTQPNPIGGDGLPAAGELEHGRKIAYGMPDVLGRDRALYAGAITLVLGAGYSAANVLLDLAKLAEEATGTRLVWVVRGTNLARVYGGGEADDLPARGMLGGLLRGLVERGAITLVKGFAAIAVEAAGGRIALAGETAQGPQLLAPVDRIVVATGQRPDLAMTRELRLELDPWLESVRALGPLIDPNLHSCGSVAPHGYRELAHPEEGFFTVGAKSYGRAPTFLLLTGYEQAHSVAAALAGELAAAAAVELKLPETGVCVTDVAGYPDPAAPAGGCCGGPTPVAAEACCVADMAAREAGRAGCGCGMAA
jgi:glycine/D-amino acid oxidase-like deaminating enzyme